MMMEIIKNGKSETKIYSERTIGELKKISGEMTELRDAQEKANKENSKLTWAILILTTILVFHEVILPMITWALEKLANG